MNIDSTVQKGFPQKPNPFKKEEMPLMSATTYPPAAWRCSTLGDGGLNFRVRNGIG